MESPSVFVEPQFPADDGFQPPQHLGNLCLAVACFHQYISLVLFFPGKLRVARLRFLLSRRPDGALMLPQLTSNR